MPFVVIPTLSAAGWERTKRLCQQIRETTEFTPIVINNGRFNEAELTAHALVWEAEPSVAASWNRALRWLFRPITSPPALLTPVVFLNDDVVLAPGSLTALYDAACGQWPHVVGAEPHAFAAFALSPKVAWAVGTFDEQFLPAYYEDTDYERRLERARVDGKTPRVVKVDVGLRHDEPGTTNRDLGLDWRLATAEVKRRYEAKWGGDRSQPYSRPYNRDFLERVVVAAEGDDALPHWSSTGTTRHHRLVLGPRFLDRLRRQTDPDPDRRILLVAARDSRVQGITRFELDWDEKTVNAALDAVIEGA